MGPKRVFEGAALLRKLTKYGLLEDDEKMLDFVLGLNVEKLLDRRLQTIVAKKGLARSIHMARVMIRQRHISVPPARERPVVLGAHGFGAPHRPQRQQRL